MPSWADPFTFPRFFEGLRSAGVPASLREHLAFLSALDHDLAGGGLERLHALSRACLVKDERRFDRFDRVFGEVFQGVENLRDALVETQSEVPADWLAKRFEKLLSQDANRNLRAVMVWDRRDFRDLDDTAEIGTRAIKVALRRLRRFARAGAPDGLDLDGAIEGTARQGWLDVEMRPERRNGVKVLPLLDVGGSTASSAQCAASRVNEETRLSTETAIVGLSCFSIEEDEASPALASPLRPRSVVRPPKKGAHMASASLDLFAAGLGAQTEKAASSTSSQTVVEEGVARRRPARDGLAETLSRRQ